MHEPAATDYDAPAAVAHFERIWTGQANGFSEADHRRHRADYANQLAAVRAGTMRPSKVVGTGHKNARAVAIDWLTRMIAQADEALASRGRTDAVNRSNVRHYLRTQS